MGTLTEQEQWPEGVRYFEENAVLTGGPDAPDNLPLSDLANRTKWLKARITELLQSVDDHESAADPHPVYMTEAEATALISAAVSRLVNSSPTTLDTLAELAAALGNDANFSTTVTNALAQKAPLASPVLTGIPTAPTAAPGTSTQQIATTKFVTDVMANAGTAATESVAGKVELATAAETIAGTDNQRAVHPAGLSALLALFAKIDSPALTGAPTSVTPSTGDNSTKIATTAYVKAQLDSPTLTGVPTAPTAGTGTTSNQVATTAFVHSVVAALVNSAPAALDTLSELAGALGNDANFATTVTNALAGKQSVLTFDETPTSESSNPVTSKGIYNIIATLQLAIAKSFPIGSSLMFYGTTAPEHYLVCDGSAISRAEYPELYAVIGTTYGAGDGSTTYNLPNMIDRFAQGSNTPGRKIEAGLPNIAGSFQYNGGGATGYLSGSFYSDGAGFGYYHGDGQANFTGITRFSAQRSNPTYGASNTVQPPSLTLLPCIKYE